MPRIIAIEGLDASGKSTQAHRLAEYFTAQGQRVGELSFPRYESFFGRRIRTLLDGTQTTTADTLDPRSMALWFAMDRWDALNNDATDPYDVLILNRWILSNAVYQGARAVHEADAVFDWVMELETRVLGLPTPDASIVLSISVAESMRRASMRASQQGASPDVYERHTSLLTESFRLYARAVDRGLAMSIPVDGKSVDEVHREVCQQIETTCT
jgi:dTMP kinase